MADWAPPGARLQIGQEELHVHWGRLDVGETVLRRLGSFLAEDERSRAQRFVFPLVRSRFTASRGFLRLVLGRYLCAEPSGIAFAYGPHGKPSLAGPCGEAVSFNLSHSAHLCTLAVTSGARVGVDVERLRPDIDYEGIARRFFSSREARLLLKLPTEVRHTAFFTCWTRKEAFLKARGGGLSTPLDEFEVSLLPGDPPALIRVSWDPTEVDRWTLRDLETEPGFAAALAWDGPPRRLQHFGWTPESML